MVKLVIKTFFAYPKNLVHPHGGWTKDKSCEKQAEKFISKELQECLICKEEKDDSKMKLKREKYISKGGKISGKPSQLSCLQQIPLKIQTISMIFKNFKVL